MRLAVCITAALIGCGDNLGDPHEGLSGSRIRIERYVFDDGTRLPITRSFHDAARDERCAPRTWSDGSTYCTPATSELAYRDGYCTMPVGRIATGTTPSYFVRYFRSSTKAWISHLYPAAGKLSIPEYYSLADGATCNGPFPGDAGQSFYELGGELSSADFVRIRRVQPAGEARLGVVRETSDDGLDVAVAIRDRTLGTECMFADHHNASKVACAPAGGVATAYFHDGQCSELAVSSAESPDVIVSDREGCASYFSAGVEVTGDPLYVPAGAACIEVAAPGGQRQFLLGAPLSLAVIDRELRPSARISRIDLVAGSSHMFDELVFDTALGADCLPEAGHCRPATNSKVLSYFSDAQCVVPLELAFVPNGSCDPTAPFARTDRGDIHELRAPYQATIYEISTGDRCVPFIPPPRMAAYAIDPALSFESFAATMIVADR
jgi:hypothetical protein